MEMFTVKMPQFVGALAGDPRLLSTVARLADSRHAAAQHAPPVLSDVSRHFCSVLAAHLVECRMDALKVRCHQHGAVFALWKFPYPARLRGLGCPG